MKIIKLGTVLTVVLNDGSMLSDNKCTDEIANDVYAHQNDEEYVKNLLAPKLKKKEETYEKNIETLKSFEKSKDLTIFGSSIYLKKVSEITMPEDLAKAYLKAELDNNQELIDTYTNFWTLACLNPDSRARTNLFWFLNKYGMTVSKSGLFTAYRNVHIKKEGKQGLDAKTTKFISSEYIRVKTKLRKAPKNYFVGTLKGKLVSIPSKHRLDEGSFLGPLNEMYKKLSDITVSTVYTDDRTQTMTIVIGKPVTIPREECDANQNNTCSRGLHVGGREWINKNGASFGGVSLKCLVNPADVVAVPPSNNYGKMRICAYYPIEVVGRNESNDIASAPVPDGFETDFLDIISSQKEISTEDLNPYKLDIPNTPEISTKTMLDNLENIKILLKKKHGKGGN